MELNSVDDVVTFDKKVRAPNLVTAENITPLLQDVEDEIYTNVYTISQMNEKLQLKADAANVYDKDYINTEFINVRNEMSYKADSNNVYPKTETYNRTEIDDMISGSVIPIDAYTKEETNNLLNFKADKAHTYTKEEISNFGLGTIITTKTDPQSQLQKLSIANHTELQKLYIGEEDSGMSFRFIESEVSYPEVMKILGDERTLKVSQYKLNAQMGITTNELLADNIYTKEEVDALIAGGGGGGTNDYNQLINRPIIDGIVQSNLDMNGNSISNTSNMYTKTEVDDLISNIPVKIEGDIINKSPDLHIIQEEGTTRHENSIVTSYCSNGTIYLDESQASVNLFNCYAYQGSIKVLPGGLNRFTTLYCIGCGTLGLKVNENGTNASGLFVGDANATISHPNTSIFGLDCYNYETTTSGAHFVMGPTDKGIVMVYDSYNNVSSIRCNGKSVNDVYSKEEVDQKIDNISNTANLTHYYTKTECDEKFGDSGGTVPDPLSINQVTAQIYNGNTSDIKLTFNASPDENNGVMTIGGFYSTITIDEGNTCNGVLTVGGTRSVVMTPTASSKTSYSGVISVGGYASVVALSGSNQSALAVGCMGRKELLNNYDAWFHVGKTNGLDVMYDGSADQTTMMMNGKTVNVQYSQTITHEAPFTGEITEYSIGDPVFASGRVCKWNTSKKEWTYETGPMDCICEVKPEGTVGEYVGICVAFVDNEGKFIYESNENIVSVLFATGGDFYFNVADSSKYKIGDVILLDGTVLKDDMALTGKVMKMMVGKVTAKINKTTVAVLKE